MLIEIEDLGLGLSLSIFDWGLGFTPCTSDVLQSTIDSQSQPSISILNLNPQSTLSIRNRRSPKSAIRNRQSAMN
jgi:hypothetical protein